MARIRECEKVEGRETVYVAETDGGAYLFAYQMPPFLETPDVLLTLQPLAERLERHRTPMRLMPQQDGASLP